MTTVERRPTDDELEQRFAVELPVQSPIRLDDDDFFEPTIERGRE
jgi:hypothetical protein